MWNPIKALIEAYLQGRKWQMERLDREIEQLERIADAIVRLVEVLEK